jgi:hypothetical protein
MCPYLGQNLVASPVCFHQNFVPFRLGESPAKQMNPEALSQVLEAVAFIFVTPEFIEERKLTKVRTALDNLIIRIITVWLDPHYSASPRNKASIIISVFVTGLSLLILSILMIYFGETHHEYSGLVMLPIIIFFPLSILTIVMCLIALLIFALEKVLIRGILFVVGSAAFFLSKMMMFWAHY